MVVTRPLFNYSYEFCILLFLIHVFEETGLKNYTKFLYFSFTTSCLVFNSFHRDHCDVTNNKFMI